MEAVSSPHVLMGFKQLETLSVGETVVPARLESSVGVEVPARLKGLRWPDIGFAAEIFAWLGLAWPACRLSLFA